MDFFSMLSKAEPRSPNYIPPSRKPKFADVDHFKPATLSPLKPCLSPRAVLGSAGIVAQYIWDKETNFPQLLGRDVSQRVRILENVMKKWTVAAEIVLPNAKCHNVSMSINLNGHLVAHSHSGAHATLIDPRSKGAGTCEISIRKPEGYQLIPGASSERFNHVLFANNHEHILYTSSAHFDNYLRIWDIRNLKQPIASLCTNSGNIVDIAHNSENGSLLFAHHEGPFCWWDVELAQCKGTDSSTGEAPAANKAGEDSSPLYGQLLSVSSLRCIGISAKDSLMFLGTSAGFFVIFPTLELSGLAPILNRINLSKERMEKGYFEWFKQTLPKAYRDKVLCLSEQDYLPTGWDKVSLLSSAKLCNSDGYLCVCAHVTAIPKPLFTPNIGQSSVMRSIKKDLLLQLTLPPFKPTAAGPCMQDMMFGSNFRTSLTKLESVHYASETLYRPMCRKYIDASAYPCPLVAVPSINGVKVWRLHSSSMHTASENVDDGVELCCLSEISTHQKLVVNCCVSPRDLIIYAADVEGKVQVLKPQL